MDMQSNRNNSACPDDYMRQGLKVLFVLVAAFSLIPALSGCDQDKGAKKISLAETVSREDMQREYGGTESLRVAVAAIISPQASFDAYNDLLRYLGTKLNIPLTLVQRKTYKEINELIGEGAIDLAFVCTGAYVAEGKERNMELLAAPVVQGESVYYSYIIASRKSDIDRVEDLQGKRFAFTDPLSNSGFLAPQFMFVGKNLELDRFFSETIFTHSHDRSIEAVAKGLVDGASVDSLVYDSLAETEPDLISRVRIIEKSPQFGIPPVVVAEKLDPEIKHDIQAILLGMHEDQEGKAILKRLRIDKFIIIDDSLYDEVREIYRTMQYGETDEG